MTELRSVVGRKPGIARTSQLRKGKKNWVRELSFERRLRARDLEEGNTCRKGVER